MWLTCVTLAVTGDLGARQPPLAMPKADPREPGPTQKDTKHTQT